MHSNRYGHKSKENKNKNKNENRTAGEAKRFIARFQLFGYENQQKWCFLSLLCICWCGAISRIKHSTVAGMSTMFLRLLLMLCVVFFPLSFVELSVHCSIVLRDKH